MKKTISWILRLAVVGYAAWLLQPLYRPSSPTRPIARGVEDYVRWSYQAATNQNAMQRLTVYGDGRNVTELFREMGDPDMPETITNWRVRRDKTTGLTHFTREDLIPRDRAKQLLDEAIAHGALDITTVPTASPDLVEIESRFDGRTRTGRGPQELSSTFDWLPQVWSNRIRWQKLAPLPTHISQVAPHLEKKDYILTDDAGNPVKTEK